MWNYLYMLPGAFLAPIIHEWIKALCSTALGDPTPKNKGFMSGNPLKFFEPVGFFLLLMTQCGWGRPVPTSPLHYKNRRRGVLITYITPSVVNLALGILVLVLENIFYPQIMSVSVHLDQVLSVFALFNINLAVFNIIPVYPLDGARVLQLFLLPQTVAAMNRQEKLFQVILLLLLFFGILQNFIINPLTGGIIFLLNSIL